MNAIINVINVEKGDAIIIQLINEEKKALILIDGGSSKFYSGINAIPRTKKRLEELLPDYNNTIDLVIITHYCNDHIGALNGLFNSKYAEKVKNVWTFLARTPIEIPEKLDKGLKYLMDSKTPNYGDFCVLIENNLSKLSSIEAEYIYESLTSFRSLETRLKELVEKGSLKITEPFPGLTLDGFEMFRVIAPSPEYYNSLIGDIDNNYKIIRSVKQSLIEEQYLCEVEKSIKLSNIDEFSTYDYDLPKKSYALSALNKISIVCLLEINDLKYLFTGDAGIENLKSAKWPWKNQNDDWEKVLEDIYFLDVPHHGSRNNLSEDLIDSMKPEISIISAPNKTNHPSKEIVECLKQYSKEKIYITNEIENTYYFEIDCKNNKVNIILD